MARLTDTVIGQSAYGLGENTETVDLRNGGQFGHMADFKAWVSSTPYVQKDIVFRLLEAPRGFGDLDSPDKLRGTLKALLELHAKTIEGYNAGLTMEFAETNFNRSGEMQEYLKDVKRTRSEPVFTFVEKYGRPITRFLEYWVEYLGMDPATGYPNIITTGDRYITADMLPDYSTCSGLAFETDPTFSKIDKAWISVNMFPKTMPEVTGKRDQTSAGDMMEISVTFTAISQTGVGVRRFAQRVLDAMNLTGTNPNLRPAVVDQIDPDVASSIYGYSEQLDAAGRVATQL